MNTSGQTASPEKNDEGAKNVLMTAIGLVAMLLVYFVAGAMGEADHPWLRQLAPYAMVIGIALFVFYQFLFVANVRLARLLRGEFASQAALAVLLTWALITSAIDAATLLNEIFGLDPGAFPHTLKIMTFVYMFMTGEFLFWCLLVWSVLAFFYFLLTGGSDSIRLWIFMLSGIAVSGVALLSIHCKYDKTQLRARAYLVARSADFYASAYCNGAVASGKFVFLGPEQRRLFVDQTLGMPDIPWMQALFGEIGNQPKKIAPSKTRVMECTGV